MFFIPWGGERGAAGAKGLGAGGWGLNARDWGLGAGDLGLGTGNLGRGTGLGGKTFGEGRDHSIQLPPNNIAFINNFSGGRLIDIPQFLTDNNMALAFRQ